MRLVAVIALVLVCLPAAQATAPLSSAQSNLAVASVDPTQPGATLSPTYLGFSHEWDDAPPLHGGGPTLMGSPGSGTNPIYRQLLENLLAYGAGPFPVRIGGNSTDYTKEPSGPNVVAPFAQLYSDIGATFTFGVNLASGNPKLGADQARAYVQGMPPGSIDAIEIGNEPDYYAGNGHRPKSYTFQDYLRDFAAYRSAIMPVLPPNVKLVGPSWGATGVLAQLPRFLDQEAPNLSTVSQHSYSGTSCANTKNPPDFLLNPGASTSVLKGPLAGVGPAHQLGLQYRMGEFNSISCGGEPGVSDTFPSALWLTDILFEFANSGVDGVDIHFGNHPGYGLFTFNVAKSGGSATYSVQSIRPSYYGALLFQQSAPAGARLVPVNLSTSANLKVWATEDGAGTVRLLVLNKDRSASGPVSIQLAGYGDGALTRLLAPTFDAQTGLTLGGQTFDGSQDGSIQGAPTSDTVSADSGTYTFDMPPVSAALMVVYVAGS
jgi:hypothetical protein